jgi:Uma2 family endonuclease
MASAITTAEELLHAGDIGRCELVRGRLVMLKYRGGEDGRIAAEMGCCLGDHVEARRLGTLVAGAGFVLARRPDTVRAPAVAFVRGERVPGPGYFEGAPDLAVEVVSPFDPPGYAHEKVAEWLEAGTKAVWVVDPGTRTVAVHEPGRKLRTRCESDVLRGGDVLPGFELPVREIFG